MDASNTQSSILKYACLLLIASLCSAKTAIDTGNLLVRYEQQKKDAVRRSIVQQGYDIVSDSDLAGVFTVRLRNTSVPLDFSIKQV